MKSRFQLLALSASFALTLALVGCAEDNNAALNKSGAAPGKGQSSLPSAAEYNKAAKNLNNSNNIMKSKAYQQSQAPQ